jgi:hypothetical protein
MAKKATAAPKPAAAKAGKKGGGPKGGKGGKGSATKPRAMPNGHNGDRSSENAIQANFISHRSLWNKAQASLKVAEKNLRDMVAAAKADGFQKKEFQIADALVGSPKKEAKIVGEVTTRLRVARWIGHAMGKQYDLFENPAVVVVSSAESAYEDGRLVGLAAGAGTPPPQFAGAELSQRWMAGFHDATEQRVKSGIKPLEDSDKGNVVPIKTDGSKSGDEPWEGADAPPAGWGPSKLPAAARTGSDL